MRGGHSVLWLYLYLHPVRTLLAVRNGEDSGCALGELSQGDRGQMILGLIAAVPALRHAGIDHLDLDGLLLLRAIFPRYGDGQRDNLLLLIVATLSHGEAVRVDRPQVVDAALATGQHPDHLTPR